MFPHRLRRHLSVHRDRRDDLEIRVKFRTEFGYSPVLQLELLSVGPLSNYARVPADQETIRISVLCYARCIRIGALRFSPTRTINAVVKTPEAVSIWLLVQGVESSH
jgi:hypothetical protein